MDPKRVDKWIKELDGERGGLLNTFRKYSRSRPILASLVLMASLGFGGIAIKKGAEKVEQVRLERVIEESAKNESLSQMPKHYTNKFQALDDAIVLRKAWQMIDNPYFINKYTADFIEAKRDYEHLSEKDRHYCDLLERSIGLMMTEARKLPSAEYSKSRERALTTLKKSFVEQFECAQDGHGLLKGISPKAYEGVKCGAYHYEIGLETNGPYVFESAVWASLYDYETQAERVGQLNTIRQQVVHDNPSGHAQGPRTGGRVL